jgi:hypothetical protein
MAEHCEQGSVKKVQLVERDSFQMKTRISEQAILIERLHTEVHRDYLLRLGH